MSERDSTSAIIRQLRKGNDQYVAALEQGTAAPTAESAHADEPPLAIALVCSDMTVDIEKVFELKYGQLYVLQASGYFAGSASTEVSMAFALHGLRLVLVIGHGPCPLIDAAAPVGHTEHAETSLLKNELVLRNRLMMRGQWQVASEEVAKAKAVESAARLRRELVGLPSLEVVPAYFDEKSGRVQFLPEASN